MNEIICCVAGKSGGHIIPGLIWLKNCLKDNSNSKIIFFSTNTKLDQTILSDYLFINNVFYLNLQDFPGKKIADYPLFIYQFFKTFLKCLRVLFKTKPTKVISLGGSVSIPVCLAAWFLKIPIELFELNAVPGKAIKFLAPLSKRINICFDQAKNFLPIKKIVYSNYPLRFTKKNIIEKKIARRELFLNEQKKTIFVLGGSQGSHFLNNLIIKFFKEVIKSSEEFQVIHQTGSKKLANIQQIYNAHKIESLVFDFRKDLEFCYCAADLVISRAGAGSLFELAFFKKKAIIIPLETKVTNHQVENAKAMKKMKPELFSVIEQTQIIEDPKIFYQLIKNSL